MEQTLKQILDTQIGKLPKSILELLASGSLTNNVETVVFQYDISQESKDTIEDETVLVVIGLESLEDYEHNLIENAGLTAEQAEKIALAIVSVVIRPIQGDWYKFLEQQLSEEPTQESNITTDNAIEKTPKEDLDSIKEAVRANNTEVSIKNLISGIK